MAKAYTESIRPVVKAYQAQILEKHKFPYKEGEERGRDYVKDADHAYLMSDEDADTLFAEMEEAKKAYPFGRGLEQGACPLLVAENLQRQSRMCMIDEAAYITGINYDDITMLEHYAQVEELVEKIVINHPKYKHEFNSKQLLQAV